MRFRGLTGLEIRWTIRESAGGKAISTKAAVPLPAVPDVWLRIERQGNLITGRFSGDGVTWLDVGEATLGGLSQFGIAVAANEPVPEKKFAPLQVALKDLHVDSCGTGDRAFLRGEVNVDERLDLSDAITILGYLFLGAPPSLSCEKSADADDSGTVDITDAVRILGYLFLGQVPPELPFGACGMDPTADPLTCLIFSTCGE